MHVCAVRTVRNIIKIDVLICTYKRTVLDQCLTSVLAQDLPEGLVVNVIVADNASTKWALECVMEHAKNTPITIQYLHAPADNISIARNACLESATGDYVAFLDDDEIAPNDWLAQLCWDMGGHDVVFGPVVAQYPPDAPNWIVRNDFHSTTLDSAQGVIQTGYAGNVVMRWRGMPWVQERFDLALGATGGEDTDFFNRLYKLGAILTFSPHAYVHEPVAENRLCIRWLAKRRFRSGQSFADIAMQDVHRAVLFSTAFLKSVYSVLAMFIFAMSEKRAGFWLMRCLFHMGVFSRSIQLRTPQPHKVRR